MAVKTLYVGASIGDLVQFSINGELYQGVVCMRVGNQYKVHAARNGKFYRFQIRPRDIVNNLSRCKLPR